MKRLDVDVDTVVRMYVVEGLRGAEIARRLGCGESVVYERLERAGVKRSRRARVPATRAAIRYAQGATLAALAAEFGVSAQAVSRALQDAGIATRVRGRATRAADRRPCPQSREYRAYVLGLVWGDFAVAHAGGQRVVHLWTNTTRPEQIELTRVVFGAYGPVRTSGQTVRVSLDASFEFLMDKGKGRMPAWVKAPFAQSAFAAGYIDAEGSFGVYEGRARFKVDSYDEAVHVWLHDWLDAIGIRHRSKIVARRGQPRSGAHPGQRISGA